VAAAVAAAEEEVATENAIARKRLAADHSIGEKDIVEATAEGWDMLLDTVGTEAGGDMGTPGENHIDGVGAVP